MADSDCVIKVENLGKCYTLGQIHHNKLAEAIGGRVQNAFNLISSRALARKTKPTEELYDDEDLHHHYSRSLSKHINPMHEIRKRPKAHHQLLSSGRSEFWAIRNVSFKVNRGEVTGVIGLNGAGKSTLLKILARITEPTEGMAWMKGRVASLLEVGTGFHPELTGRENIFLNGTLLGMSRAEIKRKFDEIVAFAEVERFLDTPVKRYSSGMYVRLAFAIAAHLEPEILLVDEVLAVGDAIFQERCLDKMQQVTKEGRTILFVSHDMLAVQSICPHTILLGAGNILFQGDTDGAISHYLKQGIVSARSSVELKNHIGRPNLFKSIFRNIRILTEDDVEDTSIITLGEGLIFELVLETGDEVLKSPVVLIELRDSRETSICRFVSDSVPVHSLQPCGKYMVRCVWKTCRLVPGIYSINLELKDQEKSLDLIKHAAAIQVRSPTSGSEGSRTSLTGFIVPEGEWEYRRL